MLPLERDQTAVHFGHDRLLRALRSCRVVRQSRGVSQQQRSVSQQRDLDQVLVRDNRHLDRLRWRRVGPLQPSNQFGHRRGGQADSDQLATGAQQHQLQRVEHFAANRRHQDFASGDSFAARQRQEVQQQTVERPGRLRRRLKTDDVRQLGIGHVGDFEHSHDGVFARHRHQHVFGGQTQRFELLVQPATGRRSVLRGGLSFRPLERECLADADSGMRDFRIQATNLSVFPIQSEKIRHGSSVESRRKTVCISSCAVSASSAGATDKNKRGPAGTATSPPTCADKNDSMVCRSGLCFTRLPKDG